MKALEILLVTMTLPALGLFSFCYAIYLFVRKKPSGDKMMILREEDIDSYLKTEILVFTLWGVTITFLGLLSIFTSNRFILSIVFVLVILINIYGYYLRIMNNRKYLRK